MFVNSLAFFTSVLKWLMYQTAEYIPNRHAPTLKEALNNVLKIYSHAQFKVTTMYADIKFNVLKDYIEDKCKAHLNCAAADEHVPEAKNNNKALKECA